MRSIHQWLAEYGHDHRNPTNKWIHWICVPLIVWSILAALWGISIPAAPSFGAVPVNAALLAAIAGTIYYLALSWRLALGLALFSALLLWSCFRLAQVLPWALWQVAIVVFVLAWIGQFIGHHFEGRRPAFFTDVQFLLIGPAWLMGYIYRQLGWRY